MSGLLGSGSPTNKPIIYSGLNVSSSQWNMPLPVCWGQVRLSTNAIAYENFQKHSASGKGGGKGGGGKGGQQYTYSADVLMALCEGPIDSIQNIWASGSTTTTTTLSQLNMVFFNGTASQAPWSYWQTNYPARTLAYAQTAYLGAANLNLGESATIPDNGFEIVRASILPYQRSSATSGWINPNTHVQQSGIDVLLSDCTTDFLTNLQYGINWASADIGPIGQWATYTQAQGLFFSPLINTQEKTTDILTRWGQLTNSWIFWGGTALMFVPLGDSVITGNGVTYTPQNDVAYVLQLSDLLAAANAPPVKVTRKDPADCFNRTIVNITDRTLGYIDNPVPWSDDNLIDSYGLRDNTSVSAGEIKDPAVGVIVAQLIGKRAAYIRNTYAFKTSYRFILCLPGTVLEIPLNFTGLTVRVRVVDIAEDDKGELSFTAEEFPGTIGTYAPPLVAAAANPSSFPNIYAAPGNVNTPAIVEPPSSFTGGQAKIIVAASGQTNWGGADVWLSFDGVSNYRNIGTITTPAVQGVLTAGLAAFTGANPDTADTLSVDCAQSGATPMMVTNSDAQMLRTLALVAAQPTVSGSSLIVPANGELLAFGAVATTGTNTADLTYLERGQYGTAPAAQAAGSQFTLLDVLATGGSSVAFDLPPAYIGQTLYFKIASFNDFTNGAQDLTTCVEYQYTPTGAGYGGGTAGAPAAPTGVAVGATTFGNIGIAWNANPASDNVQTYSVYRANGLAASFGTASVVWTGKALVYTDTNITSGAAYTFFVVATNSVGNSPPSTSAATTATSSAVTSGVAGGLVLTGAINGTNKVFTMVSAIPSGSLPLLSVNGTYQNIGADYSISGTTLTFVVAPPTAATLALTYTQISIPNFGYLI